MGRITIEQSHQIVAILATNTDWSNVDFDGLQDTIVRNQADAGVAFTAWLKSGATTAAVMGAPIPPKKEQRSVFKFHAEVLVGPLTKRFVRREFFKTREGLYLSNDMERVLEATEDSEPTEVTRLKSSDLRKNSYDREIKAELPGVHEVELWQIGDLIERQKNGDDGSLLTNGDANIFYVARFAVRARWFERQYRWNVDSFRLGGDRWGRDGRVFSKSSL